MTQWLDQQTLPYRNHILTNSRDSALSRVGPFLYEKFFRHYTIKQWNKDPEELDASVLNRIPIPPLPPARRCLPPPVWRSCPIRRVLLPVLDDVADEQLAIDGSGELTLIVVPASDADRR
jgi:hypothetical protein